jgi:hypothetical protein
MANGQRSSSSDGSGATCVVDFNIRWQLPFVSMRQGKDRGKTILPWTVTFEQ